MKQKAAHREKVSVVGALWLTARRHRLTLSFQTLVNSYFTNVEVGEFLSVALQWLSQPLVVIWDGGTMHKGGCARKAQPLCDRDGCMPIQEHLHRFTPKLFGRTTPLGW